MLYQPLATVAPLPGKETGKETDRRKGEAGVSLNRLLWRG